jgi:hypothetical protein|tara:strand:+ start:882 stop:1091 length:210 start_codon:yes stop_codon:yes gene_type:complete
MEAWVLIIAFAFFNADEKLESGSFSISMASKHECEERVKTFENVKFSFGDKSFSSSASCFDSNSEEVDI